MGRRSTRLALAALLSAVLHAAALAWLSKVEGPRRPEPTAETLVELDVTHVAPPPAAPAGSDAPGEPRERVKHPTTAHSARRGGAPEAARAAEDSLPSGEVVASIPGDDVPRRAEAVERLEPGSAVARSFGVGELTGAGAGVTLRPGDADPAMEAARERALVTTRIGQALSDAQAAHRAQTGAVDSYFDDLRKALAAAAASPPQLKETTNPIGAALRSYTAGLERYGASGNPYADGERPSSIEAGAPGGPKPGHERDPNSFAAFDRSTDFLDGKFGSGIVALVEVRQDAQGGLLGTRLVASSGLADFDAYVVDSVPTAVARLAPPPKQGLGLHPEGILSLWAFEGKIVYMQPMQGAGDAVYLVLPFHFEETTGDVYVAKIDKPKFECRVRLLRVY